MPQTPPTTTPERRTLVRALSGMGLLGVLCLLLVLGAATIGPWRVDPVWQGDLPEQEPTSSPRPTPPPTQAPPAAPEEPEVRPESTVDLGWLGWLVAGAAAIALVLLVIRLVLYWRRPREEAPAPSGVLAGQGDPEPDLPTIREGLDRAGLRLREAGPPRDAIIAAWVAIEKAAERSGVPRRPAQTPTEHATTVLHRTGADAAPTGRLLRLYQQARFSATAPTESDLDAAGEALTELAASWPELASSTHPGGSTHPSGNTQPGGSTHPGGSTDQGHDR